MQNIRLIFLLIILPNILFAQQKSKIKLITAPNIFIDQKTNITHLKYPQFEHDGAILTCDSARLWEKLNYFEAFGNVHINQDTINIYSDLLNYDGNAKMAHLVNNVRMSDPSSVLTTNVFDYNMATRVGTYVDNGKIINRKDGSTVTSKRGYYLASTKDAYFRYNVEVITDSVKINSDTLRYNTFSNQAYFYGPTNIKGKNDNLYTENGTYNTKTKKAFFGLRNLYTQDTKSLRGDSLYYDGIKGYGKATKNVTFIDTKDQMLIRAQLGEYFKESERIHASIDAYIGIATSDSITVDGKRIPDTLWVGAENLVAERSLLHLLKTIPKPTVLQDDEVGSEDDKKSQPTPNAAQSAPAAKEINTADSEKSDQKNKIGEKKTSTGSSKLDSASANKLVDEKKLKLDSTLRKNDIVKNKLDSASVKKTQDAGKANLDSLKNNIALKKASLVLDSLINKKPIDSLKPVNLSNKVKEVTSKPESPSKNLGASTKIKPALEAKNIEKPFNPADTVRTRTIRAFHKVKVFKKNLQAVSDSLFFTAADSTLRLYQNPILWADTSQQTGDTIHVLIKNKKISSAQVIQNAFIANQQADTSKYNQIKGKIITAFFNDGEIKTMYVDGNAESITFFRDKKDEYQQNQTLSARIKITFENKEVNTIKQVKGIEGTFTPTNKLGKESLLTGFIWKPELRPKSKEDAIKNTKKSAITPRSPKTNNKPTTTNKASSVKPGTAPSKASNKAQEKPKTNPKTPVKIDSLSGKKKEIIPIKADTLKKN